MTEIVNVAGQGVGVFAAIEKALTQKYVHSNAFENCVIVLGYNDGGDFYAFKAKHPGKKIIIYQLELLTSPQSLWYNENSTVPLTIERTKRAKRWFDGCDLILEYDYTNLDFLKEKGYGDKTIFHPLEYSEANVRELPTVEKKYDVLFYGAINESRVALLNEVRNHFNVCIVGNFNPPEIKDLATFEIIDSQYGDYIWPYINESKVILNLHYYPGSQEQVRIYELLCNGVSVLSEKSNINYFGDLISEFSTKDEMISKLQGLLNEPPFPNVVKERFKNKQYKIVKPKVFTPKKTVVAVVVYNRYENIQRWLKAWDLCVKKDSEVVVIHNNDSIAERAHFKRLCDKHRIKYFARPNKGFDIGAFKDVAKGVIKGFPEFERLLWCTDDTIPMRKDFVVEFTRLLADDVSVVCLETSTQVTMHIRTTGFCLTKNVLDKIVFPNIVTKQDCYDFEHGAVDNFYHQLVKIGTVETFSDVATAPLFDMGYASDHRPKVHRIEEHINHFYPKKTKVTFICPIYKSFPAVIASLYMQTHKDWELLLIHDGQSDETVLNAMKFFTDPRITFIQTEKREGNWGHGLRQWALKEIGEGRLSNPDYIVITNADNYHAPVFCEYMIAGFKEGIHATYCSEMVHSYLKWKIIPCKVQRGFVDCAGVMITKEAACAVGWRDTTSHSSDWTYFEDVAKKYGMKSFAKVEGCLLIHN